MSIVNSSIRDSLIAEKLVSYYASQQEANDVRYYSGMLYQNEAISIEAECGDSEMVIKVEIWEIDDSFYIGEIKLTNIGIKFEIWDDNPTPVLDLLYYYFSNE